MVHLTSYLLQLLLSFRTASGVLLGFTDNTKSDITTSFLISFGKNAHLQGIDVIIAGAGGAAHLPGMLAAVSPLPVIGVPIKSRNSIDGWDSVLSILQMPAGVPVATVAFHLFVSSFISLSSGL